MEKDLAEASRSVLDNPGSSCDSEKVEGDWSTSKQSPNVSDVSQKDELFSDQHHEAETDDDRINTNMGKHDDKSVASTVGTCTSETFSSELYTISALDENDQNISSHKGLTSKPVESTEPRPVSSNRQWPGWSLPPPEDMSANSDQDTIVQSSISPHPPTPEEGGNSSHNASPLVTERQLLRTSFLGTACAGSGLRENGHQSRNRTAEHDDVVENDGLLQELKNENEMLLLNESFLVQELRIKSEQNMNLKQQLEVSKDANRQEFQVGDLRRCPCATRVFEELKCPICLNVMFEPHLLPCGHSGCRVCVKTWLSLDNGDNCPKCRKPASFKNTVPDKPLNSIIKIAETYLPADEIEERKKKEEETRNDAVAGATPLTTTDAADLNNTILEEEEDLSDVDLC